MGFKEFVTEDSDAVRKQVLGSTNTIIGKSRHLTSFRVKICSQG
jgi:hypothetical protein